MSDRFWLMIAIILAALFALALVSSFERPLPTDNIEGPGLPPP